MFTVNVTFVEITAFPGDTAVHIEKIQVFFAGRKDTSLLDLPMHPTKPRNKRYPVSTQYILKARPSQKY
jgi:hypothetical protein